MFWYSMNKRIVLRLCSDGWLSVLPLRLALSADVDQFNRVGILDIDRFLKLRLLVSDALSVGARIMDRSWERWIIDHILVDFNASQCGWLIDLLLNQGLCILGLVTAIPALVPKSTILFAGEELVLTFRAELHFERYLFNRYILFLSLYPSSLARSIITFLILWIKSDLMDKMWSNDSNGGDWVIRWFQSIYGITPSLWS